MVISKRSARRFKKHHRELKHSIYKYVKVIEPPFTRTGYRIWIARMRCGALSIFESQPYGD